MAADRGRVVMFTPGVLEPGGAAKHSLTIAAGLVRLGDRVTLISREATTALPRIWIAEEGYRVLALPSPLSPRLGAVLYLALAPLLGLVVGGRAPRLIALQLSAPTLAGCICAVVRRAPLAVFSFSSGRGGEASIYAASRFRRLRLWLLRRASVLVGPTPESVAELAALSPRTPTQVLPNPLDLPAEIPPLSGAQRAAFSGRLTEGKGLELLLEVWRELVEENPDRRLTLIGAGVSWGGPWRPIEGQLREWVAGDELLRRSVLFTGWVGNVTAELLNADVYVFPSESEGLSNSLLEACAQGRVVVASDIPGNRAVLGDDYPLLFRTGERDSLSRLLEVALSDSTAREAARAAIRPRMARFDSRRILRELHALLERIRPVTRL